MTRKKTTKGQHLNAQQLTFVDEYLKCFNATEAAKRAKYSARSAYSTGWDILKKPEVQALIKQRMARRALSADEVLARLSEQAKGGIYHFIVVDDDGSIFFDFSSEEAQDYLYLIKNVRTRRKRIVVGRGDNAIPWEHEYTEVELNDSQHALELLGKHYKLFSDRFELEHNVVIPNLGELLEKVYGSKSKPGK